MSDKKFQKSLTLKKVISEIFKQKIPVILVTVALLFLFFLTGLFSLVSAALFGFIFIALILAMQNSENLYSSNVDEKDNLSAVNLELKNMSFLKILNEVIESIPDSIFIIGENETIIHANKSADQNFKTSDNIQSIVGFRLSSVIRSTHLFESIKDIRSSKTSEKIEIILPGEVEKSFDVYLSRIISSSDGELNILILLRETTDLKKAMDLRSEFIANASHELKTPITVIKSIAETLDKYGLEDESNSKNFISKLLKESERAQLLIEDLLSLNQLEMRQHLLPDKTFNLVNIIDSVFDILSDLASKQKITLERSIKKKKYIITGDEKDISRAIINIVENAIKYNKKNGKVDLILDDNDGSLFFTVKDTGLGISQEHISRLTERFYRVDIPNSIDLGGTGLGLAIVKNIAIRHNAILDIESKIGEGSSFSLIFKK